MRPIAGRLAARVRGMPQRVAVVPVPVPVPSVVRDTCTRTPLHRFLPQGARGRWFHSTPERYFSAATTAETTAAGGEPLYPDDPGLEHFTEQFLAAVEDVHTATDPYTSR